MPGTPRPPSPYSHSRPSCGTPDPSSDDRQRETGGAARRADARPCAAGADHGGGKTRADVDRKGLATGAVVREDEVELAAVRVPSSRCSAAYDFAGASSKQTTQRGSDRVFRGIESPPSRSQGRLSRRSRPVAKSHEAEVQRRVGRHTLDARRHLRRRRPDESHQCPRCSRPPVLLAGLLSFSPFCEAKDLHRASFTRQRGTRIG